MKSITDDKNFIGDVPMTKKYYGYYSSPIGILEIICSEDTILSVMFVDRENSVMNKGNEKSVRAVGSANGRNKIWIIVPCHRVIGTNGSLTGYAGGIDRKQWLLNHEKNILSI